MSKENHTRMINDIFQKDLEEGILRPLVNLVRDSNDLYLAFRGKYLNVYYKSHSVFRIEKKSKGYEMTFDFNHARYTKNYEDIIEELRELGCEYKPTKQKRTILRKILTDDATFWQDCSKIFKELIEDFFCQRGKFDYFDQKKPSKKKHTEKGRQQAIALANRETKNGYFIYDIEYVQARNNKSEKNFGKPDMLAIRFEEAKPKAIVFIELKSRAGSTGNVEKHYNDMLDYIYDKNEGKNLIKTRIEDAEAIINFYKKLGMANFEGDLKLSNLEPETLFIFTDDAVNYPRKVGKYIDIHGQYFKIKKEDIISA